MSLRRTSLALAALTVALTTRSAAAQYQAFAFSGPLAGNQAFGGAFGIDFNVGSAPILVNALGAFDDGQNGLNAPITVRLYDRTTQTVVASMAFPTGTGATLNGDYRFMNLLTPLTLPGGFQGTLVASGYGTASEELYNTSGAPFPGTITTGGLVTFVGTGRYTYDATAYPTIIDSGPEVRYAGPNFVFGSVATTATPEPSTWMLLGGGLVSLAGAAARRRRTATA